MKKDPRLVSIGIEHVHYQPTSGFDQEASSVPMQFPCQIERHAGTWRARHQSKDLGAVEVTASSHDQALEKLRRELRYRLEICPCTGELYDDVAIELVVER